ncbi:LexA/Signal peptidase, partial [Aulographum hederae CBS 113979]
TVLLINDKFLEVCTVRGKSMAPTLSPHYNERGEKDRFLISKFLPDVGLERGDVVAFWKPHNPEELGVKRVIALPGDTVEVAREEYPYRKVVVPFGHVWVEGDNWRESYDSNYYGPISQALIVGKGSYIMWPLDR